MPRGILLLLWIRYAQTNVKVKSLGIDNVGRLFIFTGAAYEAGLFRIRNTAHGRNLWIRFVAWYWPDQIGRLQR